MILTCPDCATKFTINPDAIGPNGRTVRCSQCSGTWFVAADLDVLTLQDNQEEEQQREDMINRPAANTITGEKVEASSGTNTRPDTDEGAGFVDDVKETVRAAAPHAAIRARAENKKVRKSFMGVLTIWLITALILGLAVLLAYLFRAQIVEKFPGTSAVYKAFGIKATSSGLKIYGVETSYGDNEGTPVLIVNGKVKNTGMKDRDLSMIKLSFKNTNGEILDSWVVEPNKAQLKSGETIKFSSEFPNPPIDAATLAPSFVDEGLETANIPMMSQ